MAIATFNPEFWAASLIRHLDKMFVYAQPAVINRNYEGEVSEAGDTVHLQNVDDVEVGDYNPSEDIEYEEADADIDTTLVIDEFKHWAVQVDDVNKAQSHVNLMDEKTKRAAVKLRDVIDQYIASFQADAVAAGNTVDNGKEGEELGPVSISEAAEAYELLVDLGVQLDEQDVPTEGRYSVIPPWFHGLLQKDNRFVGAGTTKTDQVLANGLVGEAAGFTLFKSNNVPNTEKADYRILSGTNAGITFAEQLVKTEELRREKRFKTLVRGLMIYGAKVPNAGELAVLRVSKG